MSRYQKGKTNLDFTEARDIEWQRHQLGHMQVCTSLQTDNHASNPPLSFLPAGCPSYRPTYSVKALKAPSFSENYSEFSQNVQTTPQANKIDQFALYSKKSKYIYSRLQYPISTLVKSVASKTGA